MRQASLPMPNLKHAYNNEITTTCCTKHRLAL
jgi:hypothetical protein